MSAVHRAEELLEVRIHVTGGQVADEKHNNESLSSQSIAEDLGLLSGRPALPEIIKAACRRGMRVGIAGAYGAFRPTTI